MKTTDNHRLVFNSKVNCNHKVTIIKNCLKSDSIVTGVFALSDY